MQVLTTKALHDRVYVLNTTTNEWSFFLLFEVEKEKIAALPNEEYYEYDRSSSFSNYDDEYIFVAPTDFWFRLGNVYKCYSNSFKRSKENVPKFCFDVIDEYNRKDPPKPDKLDIIAKFATKLPEHWKLVETNSPEDEFSDDGRDYDVPFFIRKDGLARIYINQSEWFTDYMFALAFDDDGDCRAYKDENSFEDTIKYCDDWVEQILIKKANKVVK